MPMTTISCTFLSSVRISLQFLRVHREMPFSDPSPSASVLSTLPTTTRRGMLTWAVYVLSAVFDLSSSMILWELCQSGSDILPRSRSTLSSSCVHSRGLAGNTCCVYPPTTRVIPLVSPSFKLQFASSIMTESCPIHIAIAVPASLMRVVRPFVHFHLDPVD